MQLALAAKKAASNKAVRPFLKWAGGKTQIINDIKKRLPTHLATREFTYIEPFVGSGAVLFWMLNNFNTLKKVVINDINEDLITTYRSIAAKPKELLSILKILQHEFHQLASDEEQKKSYYYHKRQLYNLRQEEPSGQAALFIFLNRTCFNGLYRVNRKNEFNVPLGSYQRPTICNEENILNASQALQKVEILCGDFEATLDQAQGETLFYLDPPYKPLNQTSSFNSYSNNEFNDQDQLRLKNFCAQLNAMNYTWILSNSDVKGADSSNDFFDNLYSEFNIQRVAARRNINVDPAKRGKLTELLITNYTKHYAKAI